MPNTYRARLLSPSGQPLAGATAQFTPTPHEVFRHEGARVVPQTVTATADADGWIEVDLVSAFYAVRPRAANGIRFPTFMAQASDEPDPTSWLQFASEA